MKKTNKTTKKRLIVLMAILAAGAVFFVFNNSDIFSAQINPPTLPDQPADFPPLGTLSWGALAGWKIPDIIDFEQKIGKKMRLVEIFIHWGNETVFPFYLGPLVKEDDKTLVIFWEAIDYNVYSPDQPQFSYDAVLRGDWDSYFADFAHSAKDFG